MPGNSVFDDDDIEFPLEDGPPAEKQEMLEPLAVVRQHLANFLRKHRLIARNPLLPHQQAEMALHQLINQAFTKGDSGYIVNLSRNVDAVRSVLNALEKNPRDAALEKKLAVHKEAIPENILAQIYKIRDLEKDISHGRKEAWQDRMRAAVFKHVFAEEEPEAPTTLTRGGVQARDLKALRAEVQRLLDIGKGS